MRNVFAPVIVNSTLDDIKKTSRKKTTITRRKRPREVRLLLFKFLLSLELREDVINFNHPYLLFIYFSFLRVLVFNAIFNS